MGILTQLRVMTYNVHRCIGTDGKDSIAAITRVCRDAAPDLIALQELDAPETDEDEGAHHARDLAKAMGMSLLFCRTFRRNVGYYGHALLSRYPLTLQKVTTFPAPTPEAEPRGAIWARATLPSGTLDVISTHLGVHRRERMMQSKELLGPGWLGSSDLAMPVIVCGDLNNPGTSADATAALLSHLSDYGEYVLHPASGRTFPSPLPGRLLDFVFLPSACNVAHCEIVRCFLSDHRPVVVDFALP